jgi:hypothetical protein
MVWFAHHWVAYLIYMPVSIAVQLLPWSRMNYDTSRGQQLLPYHMLGGALANSLIAAGLTRFGVGISMIFALWSGCGVFAALTMAWVSKNWHPGQTLLQSDARLRISTKAYIQISRKP